MAVVGVSSHECGIHQISYRAVRPGCPVCGLERSLDEIRRKASQMADALDMVTRERNQLRHRVDLVYAIAEAATMLDENDLEFLKLVLYQWRDSRSVGLKTTHGVKAGRRLKSANGFIAMPRHGDPYGHLCSSIGGAAIAEYFEEATNSSGPAEAMKTLARGMARHLPGAST